MSDSILNSLNFLLSSKDFVELKAGPGIRIDLRYASANNFVGYDMYGPFRQAFLHNIAAEKFFAALESLRNARPGYGFVVFDALRPRSIQRILWDNVKGTENQRYIGNPDRGSLHNFGFAIDLSVMDRNGTELDMGAGFDDFRPIAQPQLEEQFLKEGALSRKQHQNRLILRAAMESSGFTQLPHEWWHFDAMAGADVRSRFQIVE